MKEMIICSLYFELKQSQFNFIGFSHGIFIENFTTIKTNIKRPVSQKFLTSKDMSQRIYSIQECPHISLT